MPSPQKPRPAHKRQRQIRASQNRYQPPAAKPRLRKGGFIQSAPPRLASIVAGDDVGSGRNSPPLIPPVCRPSICALSADPANSAPRRAFHRAFRPRTAGSIPEIPRAPDSRRRRHKAPAAGAMPRAQPCPQRPISQHLWRNCGQISPLILLSTQCRNTFRLCSLARTAFFWFPFVLLVQRPFSRKSEV